MMTYDMFRVQDVGMSGWFYVLAYVNSRSAS